MNKLKDMQRHDPAPRGRAFKAALRNRVARFCQDENGNITYLALAGTVVMMVFGGIGIDMMYAELKRTTMQNTLDRAVLAATDLDNPLAPQATVTSYFDAMGIDGSLVNVQHETDLQGRVVSASGAHTMPAKFLELAVVAANAGAVMQDNEELQTQAGLNQAVKVPQKLSGNTTMTITADATAAERRNKVEVSLILDISGSMADNGKMQDLQVAANQFVDTVLANDDDLVSVSLVPYSEHVNPGPDIAPHFDVDWRHGYSHCLEFPDNEFGNVTLNTNITYEQMQHYQWNYSGQNDLTDTLCPQYSYERIRPFSQDANALKSQINQLQPRAGTSIFLGMKWGAGLLDPSSQWLVNELADDGIVDETVRGRPSPYSDTETVKTIVLMTDGQHDRSMRIQDWAYDSDSEVQLWANYNFWYYIINWGYYSYRNYFYTQKYHAELGDSLLDDICDAAKDQNIVVWTIGFDVQDHGANVMQQCATSPAHFFRVNSETIDDAFSSIARTITQLRLTQ